MSNDTTSTNSQLTAVTIVYTPAAPSCNEAENEGTFEAASTELTITPSVAAPSTALTFTKGDNKSDPEYAVTKAGEATTDASVTDGVFTATAAGTYKVTATQAVDETNNICEVIKEVTITVTAEIPVASATIEGPTSGIIGAELTYTATAANATAYEWYLDDVKQGSDSAKFIYTGVKGDHVIYATATNEFTATPVKSNEIELTVTKVCGELIAFTAETGSSNIDKNITATGVVGGTAHQKTDKNGKIGNDNYYVSLTLATGSFMTGDTVRVVSSTSYAKLHLFSDAGITTIAEKASPANDDYVILQKGASTIYLYRNSTDGSNMNPTITSMSVKRACEDSDDASIHSLTVNGVEVAKDAEANKYEYTVSASYEEDTVSVAFEIHPLASASIESPFVMNVPEAGAAANGQAIKVTAENGDEVTYTVFISKAASLSDDATLSALAVAGFTLAPAFDPEVTAYTITKAYEAALPAVSAVTATPNDINASAEVVLAGNVFTITVTAEDDETTKEYTITVNNAPAVKAINEVILSNGYSAYIPEGQTVEPFVINGFYLAGEDAPTVSSYKVNNGTTWAIEDNTVTLTGVDESTATYSLVLAAVEPIEFTTDKITFDGSETWIKSGYGFDSTKKWRFSKTDDDYSREITGKTHIELFLPACDTIVLSEATGNARDIRVYVNGAALGEKVSLPKNGDLTLVIAQAKAFMLTIASAQTGGDGGIKAIRMAKKPNTPSAIDNTDASVKAVKVIRNGQLIILRDGKEFNILGAAVK